MADQPINQLVEHRMREAATWLVANESDPPQRRRIPELRKRFDLSAREAIQALKMAEQWRAERRWP